MNGRLLAIAAFASLAHQAARAQEVTPEVPAEAAPPDAPPPEAVAPAAPEAQAEPAPGPVAPAGLSPTAASEPTFGAPGDLRVSIDLPFMNEGPQLAILHESSTMNGPSSTRVVVQPSVDYFVAPRLSIGAQLGIDRVSITFPPPPPNVTLSLDDTSHTVTKLSAEARVGYAVPIASTVSLWPRLGLGYTYASRRYATTPAMTGYSVPLSLTVPFLWHPGSRFFVGAGPAFVTQLVTKSQGVSAARTTDYGLTALLGGAIGR